MRAEAKERLGALAAAALALAAWSPSLLCRFLTDDFGLVWSVRAPDAVPLGSWFGRPMYLYYRPLFVLAYALDDRLWGGQAAGFHLTNLVLHAACVALTVRCGRALGLTPLAALAAGVVLAVHPFTIGAVAWVAGRGDLLATAFVLASTLAWLQGPTRPAALAAHAVLGLLALLCKEPGAVFVAWAMALAAWRRAPLRAWLPGPLVLAAYGLLRLAVGVPFAASFDPVPPASLVLRGLVRTAAVLAFPLSDGVLLAPRLEMAAVLGLTAAALLAWRSPACPRPQVNLVLVLLGLALLPVAATLDGPRSLYQTRYLYLPGVALAWLFGLLAQTLAACWPRRVLAPAALAALLALLVAQQLDLRQWRRNGELARAIARAAGDAAAALPAGQVLYVSGHRDLEGPYFLFHGNTLQPAAWLEVPAARGRALQCLGAAWCPPVTERACGAAQLELEVEGFTLARASVARATPPCRHP